MKKTSQTSRKSPNEIAGVPPAISKRILGIPDTTPIPSPYEPSHTQQSTQFSGLGFLTEKDLLDDDE
jgi:hypothetical protein